MKTKRKPARRAAVVAEIRLVARERGDCVGMVVEYPTAELRGVSGGCWGVITKVCKKQVQVVFVGSEEEAERWADRLFDPGPDDGGWSIKPAGKQASK